MLPCHESEPPARIMISEKGADMVRQPMGLAA